MLRFPLLLAMVLLLASASSAQEANVYLVKMFDCAHQPVERSQTGFRVRGVKGLITALHGVADCQRIMASSKKGLLLDEPLSIRKIDVDHDVALLSSPQLDRAQDEGFEVAENVIWSALVMVKVYGHPYGISSLETVLTVRNPPIEILKDLIPASSLSILKERSSPNHLIKVLNLQGNLLPGHSGAPILDSRGRVLAVANGGLKEGFAGISWAIPYKYIEWDSDINRLRALARLNPNVLFASDALPTKQIDEVNDETCEQLSRLVREARTDFISIVGEPMSGGSEAFHSKILLPGVSYGYVYPKKYVGFFLFSSNDIQKVASQYYNWVAKMSSCFPNWEKKELDTGVVPKMLRYRFREKANSPIIEIGHNLELNPANGNNTYYLRLHIYTTTYESW
jgi:hypothetical protein